MTLIPKKWNKWDRSTREHWWADRNDELPWMPDFVLEGQKLHGEDTWVNPDSEIFWTLAPNPWHPGRYRWDVQKRPKPTAPTWADAFFANQERRKHEQRDSVKSLRRAEKIITGDRYNDYGPPAENFERIATYWNQYLKDNPPPLKPSDTAMLMVFVKIAREAAGHKTDSVDDAEGYLAIYEELRNQELDINSSKEGEE